MTLKELAEHPERASEKDLKILEESIRLMDQLKKQIDYTTYGVTENSGRTKDEIAKEYYMETMLLAAILEAFVSKQELEYKEKTNTIQLFPSPTKDIQHFNSKHTHP